ncbi:response regulator transcription factor [Cylindrospermum sp. FACHB-282]|uniref:response regulator transcription factor n=1 Tax=Cylindrospermum sp. FACHB-282 TaxID=2692794 RepID=UPI001689D30B|nr:response regulator transcription factor [Cylindrospermum sp. FACHB-282]MBD2387497.1 response regulator transcription factor [Cylindrospermum sp. FACHB-282]
MTHILLVEDEVKLARFIELELNYEGYQVSVAYDGLTALTAAEKLRPDLVILASMLPGVSGLEICRRLRSTGDQVPIILLTAKDQVGDRLADLDAGADDYILKPFSVEELLARVRANLGRTNLRDTADILEFADLSLNRRTREVHRGQRLIELTAKEFDLLDYLLAHPQQVITSDRILQEVWGSHFISDTNMIEQNIRYLCLKLEANHETPLLQTVHGVGYVLRDGA